jgi:hypothetical protein
VSIAFKFSHQLTLPLNAEALIDDVPFPEFDCVLGGFCWARHVLKTPARSKRFSRRVGKVNRR